MIVVDLKTKGGSKKTSNAKVMNKFKGAYKYLNLDISSMEDTKNTAPTFTEWKSQMKTPIRNQATA